MKRIPFKRLTKSPYIPNEKGYYHVKNCKYLNWTDYDEVYQDELYLDEPTIETRDYMMDARPGEFHDICDAIRILSNAESLSDILFSDVFAKYQWRFNGIEMWRSTLSLFYVIPFEDMIDILLKSFKAFRIVWVIEEGSRFAPIAGYYDACRKLIAYGLEVEGVSIDDLRDVCRRKPNRGEHILEGFLRELGKS